MEETVMEDTVMGETVMEDTGMGETVMEDPESSQLTDKMPRRPTAAFTASTEAAGLPQKSPILAAFLSFLPGLGNIYNGLYKRGVIFFLVFVSFFATDFASGEGVHLAFLIPCTIFIWFFNVFDAYRQAILINYGYRGDIAEANLSLQGWGLAPGIIMVVVGIYGILKEHLDISWDLLFEQWPWLLIVSGGGLIAQYFREQSAATDEV